MLMYQSWQDIHIPGANLAYAQLRGSDLSRANVQGARLFKAVKAPETAETFAGLGIEGIGSSAEEFRAFHKAEIAKWGKAMRDAGIRQ